MKRMKRLSLLLAALCLLAAVLAGCGSSSGAGFAGGDTAAGEAEYFSNTASRDALATTEAAAPGAAAAQKNGAEAQPAKRIYTAELTLETQDFDSAVTGLNGLVDRLGGWFQDSGVGEYGDGYRHGNYTVRIPAEKFQEFLNQVGQLCHVTWQSSSCEDVSESYYDTAGRLKTQQTKLERLQDLLAKAENMEDIITIESAISDTEQEIDALSGELRYYDARVDYSTVTLSLEEVYRLTDTEAPAAGFLQRMGTALSSGWKGFVSGMQAILIALAYGWVVLVVFAAAAGILWKLRRRRKAREETDGTRRTKPAGAKKPDDSSEES